MSDITEPPLKKARTENEENEEIVVVQHGNAPLITETNATLNPGEGTVLQQRKDQGEKRELAPVLLDPKKSALLNRLIEKSREYSRQVLDRMLDRQLAMSEGEKESRTRNRAQKTFDKVSRARRKEEKREKKRAGKLHSSLKKKSSKSRKSDEDRVAKDLEKALRRQHRREKKAQAKGGVSEKSTKARRAVEEAQTQHTQTQPKMVHGVMKNYQLDGLAWLVSLHENGLNGILADEMGLGKTLQCISVFCHLIEAGKGGHFLVVAPLSVVENWCNEFARFAPDIPLLKYWGPKEERRRNKLNLSNGVVVTSYEIIMRDYARFKKRKWGYVVVDEGHRIKNFNCLLAQKLRRLRLQSRLLLTGTPLQNNLTELWALLNFILPDMFEDLDLFDLWFNFDGFGLVDLDHSVVSNQNAVLTNFHVSLIDNLHQILKPFLLRRLKSEVLKSLPPKKEYIIYTELTPVQEIAYNEVMNHRLPEVLLDLYLKEYLLENHPDLHLKPEDFSEADRMLYGKTADGHFKRLRRTKYRRNDIQRIETGNDSDLMELDGYEEEEEEEKVGEEEPGAHKDKNWTPEEEVILVPNEPFNQTLNGVSVNTVNLPSTAAQVGGSETVGSSGMPCMCHACLQKQLQPQNGHVESPLSARVPEVSQLRDGQQLPAMRKVLPGYEKLIAAIRAFTQPSYLQQSYQSSPVAQAGYEQKLPTTRAIAQPAHEQQSPKMSAVTQTEPQFESPIVDWSRVENLGFTETSTLTNNLGDFTEVGNAVTLISNGGNGVTIERKVEGTPPTMQPVAAIPDVDVIDLTSDVEETPQEMRQSLAWRHHSDFKRQVGRLPLKNAFIQLRSICGSHYVHYTPFDDAAKSSRKFVDALTRNSSKMSVCRSLVRRLVAEGHKVLIFSQFVRMLDLIAEILEEDKIKYCQFDGRYDQEERIDQIEQFEESSEVPVLLLSTRAGGLGLNLASADTVILFDSDWNPQQDLQAIARAHRIGQTRPVKVFRLVVSNTTEELLIIKSFGKRLLERMVIREGKFNARSMAQKLADADNNHGLDEIKTLQELLMLERLLQETRSPGERSDKLGIKDINRVLTTSLEPGAELTDEEMAELMDRSPECYERPAWKSDRIQAL